MAKVTFRLPSKKVNYGYVEITGEAQELGIGNPADAHAVAQAYVNYMVDFVRSEIGTVEAASKQAPAPKDPETPEEVETLLHDELGARKIATKKNTKPWEQKPQVTATPDWDI